MFLHLAVVLTLIVLQTTVVSHVRVLENVFDLVLIMVAYLALFVSFWYGLVLVMTAGAAMNQVSAAPFGLYFFSYLWLFLLVRWASLYLHVRNVLVLSLLMAALVLGEHLLFWALTGLTAPGAVSGVQAMDRALNQCLWALGTGAIGVKGLLVAQTKGGAWLNRRMNAANGS